MLEPPPLACGTGIALADVPAPSISAATAGIFKLDTFMGSPPITAKAGRYIALSNSRGSWVMLQLYFHRMGRERMEEKDPPPHAVRSEGDDRPTTSRPIALVH
jgi:hypothetical protein